MKKCVLTLLFLTSFSIVFAETISDSLGGAERYINAYVPTMFRSKIREYLDIIGVSTVPSYTIGGANLGIHSHNEKVQQSNPCFKRLWSKFMEEERKYHGRVGNIKNSLNQTSSTTSDPQHGWYWDLAIKLSGNDNNLAMMLVGQCGHDNTVIPFCGFGAESHPRYTQGSLGQETILPDLLRDEISSIQAPNMGGSVLPSKYYHTIGAAYTACALVRNGIPGFIIRRIQKAAANTYRMMRLCESISHSPTDFVQMAQSINRILSIPEYTESDLVGMISQPISDTLKGIRDSNLDLYLSITGLRSYFSRREWTNSEELIREKLHAILSFADAAQLFKSQILQGEQCMRPQISNGRINRLKNFASNRRLRCKNLRQIRCKNAKQRLLTWWADFEWTEAQHLKGADFAIKNCRAEPNFLENLDQRSCEALKKYNEMESSDQVREEATP